MATEHSRSDEAPSAPDADGGGSIIPAEIVPPIVAVTARRESFRAIRRQLTDEELSSPGALRLVLENLERADAELVDLKQYVGRYHEADKEAAVLRAKVNSMTKLDVMFGFGVGLGGALIGLTPTLGLMGGVIGAVLAGGAAIARLRQ